MTAWLLGECKLNSVQGQHNNDDDISFIHIQLVCASVGVTVCVCLWLWLCEYAYHLSVCVGDAPRRWKTTMTMIVCKLTNKNTAQQGSGHWPKIWQPRTRTHSHAPSGCGYVCVCVGVAATGRMPNDLDKNNCAVIIIKSVFGHSTSPAKSELRFSNHLMQMVAILYVVHSRNGTPTPYSCLCVCFSLALSLWIIASTTIINDILAGRPHGLAGHAIILLHDCCYGLSVISPPLSTLSSA